MATRDYIFRGLKTRADANGEKVQTPLIDVAGTGATLASVSVVKETGACAACVWTLQTSVDGRKRKTIDSALASATAITGEGGVDRVNADAVAHLGAELTTNEPTDGTCTVTFTLRKEGGFDDGMQAAEMGGIAVGGNFVGQRLPGDDLGV